MFYLLFVLFIALVMGVYLVWKFAFNIDKVKFDTVMTKILKISVIFYCSISLLTIILPDAMSLCYNKEDLLEFKATGIALIKWFSNLAFIMLPLAVFFKNKTIRNIAVYFCTAMTVVQLVFYPQLMEYYTASSGRGLNSISVLSESVKSFLLNPIFRSVIIGIIWSLELMIPIILAIQ